MAERVKRRVAAARLAVAFVAAGTIGGAAWAQGGPPPAPTAQSSAGDAYLKIDGITSRNIVDGSLLYKDFKKRQVPSYQQYLKLKATGKHFKKVVLNRYYPKVEIDRLFIKGESNDYVKRSEISSYIKHSEADARYHKLSQSLVRGDGSVHTATATVGDQEVRLLAVPGMFTVDATGPQIKITNTSGAPLQHSTCPSAGSQNPAVLDPGQSMICDGGNGAAQTMQLVGAGAGGGPHVATINLSAIPMGPGSTQATVQILIGL